MNDRKYAQRLQLAQVTQNITDKFNLTFDVFFTLILEGGGGYSIYLIYTYKNNRKS